MTALLFLAFMLGALSLGFLAVWNAVLPPRDWRREDFELREFTEWQRKREGRGGDAADGL